MPSAHPGSHPGLPTGVTQHIRTGIGRSVPALCVRAADILSGAAAADAAEANVRIVPLHWWDAGNEQEDLYGDEERVEVVTSVKLKYVQPPLAASGNNGSVVRVSKRIIYDTAQAVVSFLSEDVKLCVDEFLEEWAKVSKMVVIAREGAWKCNPDYAVLTFPCTSRPNGCHARLARRKALGL
jgi:mediator of RNA polymerase II transcription subunit 14